VFQDQKVSRTSLAVRKMTHNCATAPLIGEVKIKGRVSDVRIPMNLPRHACILSSPGGKRRHPVLYGNSQRKAGTEGSNAVMTWIQVQLLSRARQLRTSSVETVACIPKRKVGSKDPTAAREQQLGSS
jgi:hypothetical protein